jgi:hypothetical protein
MRHPNPVSASIRAFVLFGDDRHCVDLHERARASVSCGGNDRDGCAVTAPHRSRRLVPHLCVDPIDEVDVQFDDMLGTGTAAASTVSTFRIA